MGILKVRHEFLSALFLLVALLEIQCAVHELSPAIDERPTLYRKARDDRYYLNRYGSQGDRSSGGSTADRDRSLDRGLDRNLDRGRRPGLKHDSAHPEARDNEPATGAGVEKRCIRCTTSYLDPYDYRDYYERDRYNSNSNNNYDRYDGRGGYDDRYDDRYYGRYDNRYDRGYERDRWYDRPYDRGYDYRSYDRSYDRYDRPSYDRSYDRYDRGYGYDNRGYDYRRMQDGRGLRPYDDAARGTSGWDNYGRGGGGGGYNYRTEPTGYNWGYADRGYASGYNYYGGAGGRSGGDSWRDPYSRRDPYDPYGYRGTSYLYERNGSQAPITTTRPPPSKDGESGATERPDSNPNKSPDNSGSG